jgi:hypothetical protein
MPSDIRLLYEKVMKATATGGPAGSSDIADIVKEMSSDRMSPHPAEPLRHRQSPMIESSFSPKTLLVSALGLALMVLLYFLFKR